MKLERYEEGIDGIAEDNEVRLPQGRQGGGEILFQRLYLLSGVEVAELQLGELFFEIEAGMEGDGVFTLRAASDDA